MPRSSSCGVGFGGSPTKITCPPERANLSRSDVVLSAHVNDGGTTTALIGTDLSSTKEIVAGGYMVHLAVGGVATNVDGTPYASSQVTIF